jgi:hypothetical protein
MRPVSVLVVLAFLAIPAAAQLPIPGPPPPPPPPLADLVIDGNIAFDPPALEVGTVGTAIVTVKNIGAGATHEANVLIKFPEGVDVGTPSSSYFNNCTVDRGLRQVDCTLRNPLPLPLLYLQAATVRVRFRAPSIAGSFIVEATADSRAFISESSESNNRKTASFGTFIRPQIRVDCFMPTSSRKVGETFGAWVNVHNVGTVAAASTMVSGSFISTEDFMITSVTGGQCGQLSLNQAATFQHFSCYIGDLPVANRPVGVTFMVKAVGKPSTIALQANVSARNLAGEQACERSVTIVAP